MYSIDKNEIKGPATKDLRSKAMQRIFVNDVKEHKTVDR